VAAEAEPGHAGLSEAGRGRGPVLIAFLAFGAFWGTWGTVLPDVQSHAGASDAELGGAMLLVGVGALVSMRATGALVDTYGARVTAGAALLFALVAVLPAAVTSVWALGGTIFLLGIATGAMDVAMNADAARVEARSRPLMNLAHAQFSIGVVVASLTVGAARAEGAPAGAILGAAALVLLAAAAALGRRGAPPAVAGQSLRERDRSKLPRAVFLIGLLAASSYLVEQGWLSWSALHLERNLGAAAGVGALGPAAFAGAAAVGRLGGHVLTARLGPRAIVSGGALIAAGGSALATLASSVPLGVAGILLAGTGLAVVVPTLIGLASAAVGEARRGAAVSAVTSFGYMGFIAGPVLVGGVAGLAGLRAGVGVLAVVALVLAAFALVAPLGWRR
jgi:MFS family permease